MRDVVLSDDDRKCLVDALARLFPDNTRARAMLALVSSYPERRWPNFEADPRAGWRKVMRDFDESDGAETPYAQLLTGVRRIYPAEMVLAELAVRHRVQVSRPRPRVLVVGAETEVGAPSRWSRELAVIRRAAADGYVDVDVRPAAALDAALMGQLRPDYVHVNGRCAGTMIHYADGPARAGDLIRCLERSITDHHVQILGMVLDGGGDGELLLAAFRPVAAYVAVHDDDVTDELGVRFAEKLYPLLQLAPRFEAAVTAAHQFVVQGTHGSADTHRILRWAGPPRAGRTDEPPGPGVRVFGRPAVEITFSRVDGVGFEETITALYASDRERSSALMRLAGLSPVLRNRFIGTDRVDWLAAFQELERGAVPRASTPLRCMLERAVRDFPDNEQLKKLAATYLDAGGARP